MLSIVLPTYREADNLAPLVRRLRHALSETEQPHEIIVVDDDSRDGSVQRVEALAEEGIPIRIIVRTHERGLGSAVLRGFREAIGEVLVCMDADLSHPPEAVPRLVEALRDPAVEFVIASRYVAGGSTAEGWGWWRQLNSAAATLLARPFTDARDPLAGFFALRRSVLERAARLDPIGYKIGLELIVKCRCRVVREVPIHFANRQAGESKLTFGEQVRFLRHLWRLTCFVLTRRR